MLFNLSILIEQTPLVIAATNLAYIEFLNHYEFYWLLWHLSFYCHHDCHIYALVSALIWCNCLDVKQHFSSLTLSESQFVTCSVNSSQHCDYTWIVKTDPDSELHTVEGRTLEVNKPGTYLCEANCPFRHTPCTVIAMHVEYSTI